jgi:hypothetical protein
MNISRSPPRGRPPSNHQRMELDPDIIDSNEGSAINPCNNIQREMQ